VQRSVLITHRLPVPGHPGHRGAGATELDRPCRR
jgi:hypothetical protein